MTKVIGFDLDDTIIPEVLFLRSGIWHIAGRLHDRIASLPKQRIISCMEAAVMNRNNHYSALETLLKEIGEDGKISMKEIVSDFRSHIPDEAIYHIAPSMTRILERLKADHEIKLVLITDGRSVTQRNKIHSARLNRYFDDGDIFISEETGYDKTSPDTFIQVMEKYAGADEFHYIGDNPIKDFLHPSKLGWHIHRIHPFPLMIHQGIPRYR